MLNSFSKSKAESSNIIPEETKKEEAKTEDNSHPEEDKRYAYIKNKIEKILNFIIKHQDICSKKSSATFTADKIVRLCTNIIKVIRNYNLSTNLPSVQKLYIQIIQLRRLLRVDRFFLILRDYLGYMKKKKMNRIDWFLLFFKATLLTADFNDVRAYLIQLNILSNKDVLPLLRQRVSNCYFYECIGWLLYYIHQYSVSECEQSRERFKLIIWRYLMDCIISHNQFQYRKTTIEGNIICLLGLLSSMLNLYIIWN